MYSYRHVTSECREVRLLMLIVISSVVSSSLYGCNEYKLVENESLFIDKCEIIICDEYSSERLRNISIDQVLDGIFRDNPLLKSVVINTLPLRQIPSELCKLRELREIRLKTNCLRSLPPNCFDKLLNMETISISNNEVEVLPDNLFDGLSKLRRLNLSRNKIKFIGDGLLTNISNLASLAYVDVNNNLLTSIGPWPFMHAYSKRGFYADLSVNKISSFTNNINAEFKCIASKERPILNFSLNFHDNDIQHLSGMFSAYFRDARSWLCFLKGGKFRTEASVKFGENPYSCDCLEYDVMKIFKKLKDITSMDDARCFEPPELMYERYLALPLDRMTCNFSRSSSCITGCTCIYQPHLKRVSVDCTSSSTTRTGLPEFLPPISNITKNEAFYNLKFSGNVIPILESRDYFKITKVLDLGGVQMRRVSDDAIDLLSNVEELNLCCNSLETLPRMIANATLEVKAIKLHGNNWRCECNDVWLKEWLTAALDRLEHPYAIYCSSPSWLAGTAVLTLDDEQFCQNPTIRQRNRIVGWSVASAAVASLVLVAIMFVSRRFRVEIHAYLNLHPFDNDECVGENMLYDVFFSSSYADRLFVITLVRQLESKGYRVCYHEKDFIGGQSIVDNICHAVVHSKRVVCYITRDFLESTYSVYEFQTALHHDIRTRRKRLLALVDNSLSVTKNALPDDVFQFLANHTYIELKMNTNWMNQLLYSLAVNKLGNEMNN